MKILKLKTLVGESWDASLVITWGDWGLGTMVVWGRWYVGGELHLGPLLVNGGVDYHADSEPQDPPKLEAPCQS